MISYEDCVKSIKRALVTNQTCKEIFDYLTSPVTVNNLIVFSDAGLPAISGIASTLESRYSDNAEFPLSAHQNRRYVGKIVKCILAHYGYVPVTGGFDEVARLKKFTNTQHFKTSTVYAKSDADAPLKITIKTERNT